MTYVWAMLISLVPARYRSKSKLEGSTQLVRAALLCGVIQVIVFGFISIGTFINESTAIWEDASSTVLNGTRGPSMDPMTVRLTTGTMGLTVYLANPRHLILAYLAIEGAARAFGAAVLGRALPTLSLGIVAALHSRVGGRRRKKEAAVLATDRIESARDDTYDLHILSSKPKTEWGPYTGIQYQDQLYVLDGEQHEPEPRPYGYRLRKNPEGNLLVVVSKYDPAG